MFFHLNPKNSLQVDLELDELRMAVATEGSAAGALLDFKNSTYADLDVPFSLP